MVSIGPPTATEPGTEQPRQGLVVAPFRGLRFNADTVGDLGGVVSPPYDVLDAETVRALEAGNRRNIVRLILSRRHERPYLAVLKRLESWRAKSYLVPDSQPAVYLYEYTVDATTVRGLICLVALRAESAGVILPHEDVMPAPVEDRTVLMRTTRTNLEPILLVHEGTTALGALLDEVSSGGPVADFWAADGSHHRLWTIADTATLGALRREAHVGRALIADGHHRYAAYLALQRSERDAGAPADSSAWDYGLAMLVDQADQPLTVGPIHRSVTGRSLTDLTAFAAAHGHRLQWCRDRAAAVAHTIRVATAEAPGQAHFTVTDGRAWAVLSVTTSHVIDARVLHEELLSDWDVPEDQIAYHHSLDQALYAVTQRPGVVFAVRPPDLAQVLESSAQGMRMPRKSTSFSPKPRMGVVMRDLRDS